MRYEDAGVDEGSAKRFVDFILSRYPEGARFIGAFSAEVSIGDHLSSFNEPVLLLTADGVGTKTIVAKKFKRLRVAGYDCVAMNVNDIAAQGGKPLFFLDYIAVSKLSLKETGEVIEGIIEGCRDSNTLLIGGETAQLPDLIREGNLDVAGFALGIKEKGERLLEEGDFVVGLPSSGPHANGFSLIRKIVVTGNAHWEEVIERTLWESVLEPTRIYSNISYQLFERGLLKAAVNVTGGGIPGNLVRILPSHLDAYIERSSWEIPTLFRFLIKRGEIPEDEAFSVFNMGIGFILISRRDKMEKVGEFLDTSRESFFLLGGLKKGSGRVLFR